MGAGGLVWAHILAAITLESPRIRLVSAGIEQPKPPLHPHAFPLRIVERRQRRLRGAAFAGDLDLPAARPDEGRLDDGIVHDIAHAEGAAQAVAEHAGGDAADDGAVAADR